jgi:hypothetical protein
LLNEQIDGLALRGFGQCFKPGDLCRVVGKDKLPQAPHNRRTRRRHRLGGDWIDARRANEAGVGATLAVVRTGQRLASLDGVANAGALVEKLRRDDRSGGSELHALHLLRFRPPVTAEMYPVACVGQSNRIPDIRARSPDTWVYVEVTQPDQSEAWRRAQSVLRAVVDLVDGIKQPFTLELFLRREPAEDEIETIRTHATRFCAARVAAGELPLEGLPPESAVVYLRHGEPGHLVEFAREELPEDLGLLILTQGKPGEVVVCQHLGEEYRPRFGAARRVRSPTEPDRHLHVRMPFSDERAAEFVRQEARQLPRDAPGLIMIDVGSAPGAFREWEPLIRRRFQPTINTRVSGVCLFSSGVILTPDGGACPSQTRLLDNPHAKVPLPPWVTETIAAAGAEYERVLGPEKPDAPRAYSVYELELHAW